MIQKTSKNHCVVIQKQNINFRFCLYLFDCLGFSSHSKTFHLIGDDTITGAGQHILINARLSWPLSSKGFLSSHNYCGTSLSFIMVISAKKWHLHLLPSVWKWICQHLFKVLDLSRPGIKPQIKPQSSQCEANAWTRPCQYFSFSNSIGKHK